MVTDIPVVFLGSGVKSLTTEGAEVPPRGLLSRYFILLAHTLVRC